MPHMRVLWSFPKSMSEMLANILLFVIQLSKMFYINNIQACSQFMKKMKCTIWLTLTNNDHAFYTFFDIDKQLSRMFLTLTNNCHTFNKFCTLTNNCHTFNKFFTFTNNCHTFYQFWTLTNNLHAFYNWYYLPIPVL